MACSLNRNTARRVLYKLSVIARGDREVSTETGAKRTQPQRQDSENDTLGEKLIYTEIILSVLTVRMASPKTVQLARSKTVDFLGAFMIFDITDHIAQLGQIS